MGAKKYAYIDAADQLHITVAGCGKSKGAKELAARGGLEAFKEGFTFYEAGGTESIYNDIRDPVKVNIDGHSLLITSNVLIKESTYTLGVTGEYKRILSHRKLGENETIFRDMCIEIYNVLKIKLKEHYQNENAQITKKDLISLGLFFCKGTNAYKMQLIFDLFKNNKGYLEQNEFLDEFLLCNFLIGSYILLYANKNLGRTNPLVSQIPSEEIEKYMEIYDLNGCGNLVKEFNSCFFNGMKLTFYEYKRNFKDSNGFGWIFFPEGIRQKLEENKFI